MQSWAVAHIKVKKQIRFPDPFCLVDNDRLDSLFFFKNDPEFSPDCGIDDGVGGMEIVRFTHVLTQWVNMALLLVLV